MLSDNLYIYFWIDLISAVQIFSKIDIKSNLLNKCFAFLLLSIVSLYSQHYSAMPKCGTRESHCREIDYRTSYTFNNIKNISQQLHGTDLSLHSKIQAKDLRFCVITFKTKSTIKFRHRLAMSWFELREDYFIDYLIEKSHALSKIRRICINLVEIFSKSTNYVRKVLNYRQNWSNFASGHTTENNTEFV